MKVPDSISKDEQVLFLSDILPTGYFGADIANVQPGDDVAVFGAGPVGYFSVLSSFLRGAARVFSIDHLEPRLSKTKELGAEIINFDTENPVEKLKKETNGQGVVCIDAVGFESVGHTPSSPSGDSNKKNGNNSSNGGGVHDHSQVSDPIYEPANQYRYLNGCVRVQENILLCQYLVYMYQHMINFHLVKCGTRNFL